MHLNVYKNFPKTINLLTLLNEQLEFDISPHRQANIFRIFWCGSSSDVKIVFLVEIRPGNNFNANLPKAEFFKGFFKKGANYSDSKVHLKRNKKVCKLFINWIDHYCMLIGFEPGCVQVAFIKHPFPSSQF